MATARKKRSLVGVLNWVAELLVDGVSLLLLKVVIVPDVTWEGMRTARLLGSAVASDESPAEGSVLPKPLDSNDVRAGQFLFQLQEAASQHTDGKVRLLLSLATALFAAALAAISAHGTDLVWVVALGMLSLVLLLCFSYFGVRGYESPTPPPKSGDAPSKAWAREIYRAISINECVHNVRVEIYRGAQRWLFATLAVTIVFVGLRFAPARHHLSQVSLDALVAGEFYDDWTFIPLDAAGYPASGWDSVAVRIAGPLRLLPSGDWLSPGFGGRYEMRGDSIAFYGGEPFRRVPSDSGQQKFPGVYRVWRSSGSTILRSSSELILLSRRGP
jgi:hypothetical protein